MTDGLLLFCERTGAWASRLQPLLTHAAPALCQTRSLAQCEEALSDYPRSLVVLELTESQLEKQLAWLAQFNRRYPQARCLVVAQRQLETHQWLAREFGCLAFVASYRELPQVAPLVQSYFAALPPARKEHREEVWARLPWKAPVLQA